MLLYIVVPKGFFPVQDTGVILGISEAPQSISFAAMAERQQALARVILKDPAVASLSSFIGVDGTNTTLNSGRILINLKPLGERRIERQRGHPPAPAGAGRGRGHHALHAAGAGPDGRGPRQPHAVPVHASKTRTPTSWRAWAPQLVEALRARPELRDVGSDQQDQGLQVSLAIDRSTASRLGITPQLIDDTLYDAFGQRQVSTIFTQLNQYRVVLEVKPEFQQDPGGLQRHLSPGRERRPGAARAPSRALRETDGAAGHQPPGTVPAATLSFNLAPGVSLGRGRAGHGGRRPGAEAAGQHQRQLPGTAQAFQASLANEPLLILAALVTVYIVLGVLYESYIHPITILSTLPSAGVGAILALLLCRTEFSVIALIGIILLIGIVKKNAIMMVDFALEAEREEGKPPGEAIYQACLLRFRPIMMTTMAALLGALPLALGTGVGSELRRPLGHRHRRRPRSSARSSPSTPRRSSISWFDRLARRIERAARLAGRERRRLRDSGHEPLGPLHPAAGGHDAASPSRWPSPGPSAFRFLPVSPLPQVDFPTIQVSAALPGRQPETMATSVAAPLERQFGRIAGVTEMTSTSYLGSTSVILQFDLEPQHRRRRPRRPGRHQCGPELSAGQPARQPELPQGQSGRRPDPDPRP